MAARRGKTQARRNHGRPGALPGWAWLLLGEAVTAIQVAGMVLVIIGMLGGALWRGTAMRRRTDPAREPA